MTNYQIISYLCVNLFLKMAMAKEVITYQVVVEKSPTGFSALVSELPVFTTGSTLQEIEDNIQEALQFYLEGSPKFEIKLAVSGQ